MDPVEFYTLASTLIFGGPAPGPVQCRTSIGRAYYASLNRTDEMLGRWGVPCGKGPQKHGLAVRFLHASGDPDLMTASTALNDLKTLRNRADYETSNRPIETVHQARVALAFAGDVLDFLEAVDADPARRISAEARIRSYQQKTNTP